MSHHKPNYKNLWSTLRHLKEDLTQNGIKKLAIPKLGCGLDLLDWRIVRNMIEVIFQESGIEVLVCCFNQRRSKEGCKTVDYYFHLHGRCQYENECRFLHPPNIKYQKSEPVLGQNSFKRGAVLRDNFTVLNTSLVERASPQATSRSI